MHTSFLLTGPDPLTLPLPQGLRTGDGQELVALEITYRLTPLDQEGEQIRSSLLMEIRYLTRTGAVHATEWVRLPLHLWREGTVWRCVAGPNWCWSTDWPE